MTNISISRQEVIVCGSPSEHPIPLPSSSQSWISIENPQVLGMLTPSPALRRSCDLATPINASHSPATVIGLEGACDQASPNRMNLRASNRNRDWEVSSFLLDFNGASEALGEPWVLGVVRSLSEIKLTLGSWAKKRRERGGLCDIFLTPGPSFT